MCYTIEQISKDIYDLADVPEQCRKTIDELRNEQFNNIGRVYDWRNYVSDIRRGGHRSKNIARWQLKTDLQMLLSYVLAFMQADSEDWD